MEFWQEKRLVVFGHYQCEMFVFHFLQLISRNTTLKSKQMLIRDSVRFVKNLTPTVFASSLCTKHSKFIGGEHEIVIALPIRENEVWLLLVFCDDLFLKLQMRSSKFILELPGKC
jgi:hypothetical protein